MNRPIPVRRGRWTVGAAACLLLIGCPNEPEQAGPAGVDAGSQDVVGIYVPPPTPDAGGGEPDAGPDIAEPPPACVQGLACNDGDPCTIDDVCGADGECAGQGYECEDGLECTRDVCDGKGGCSTELISGEWCLIDLTCVPDGGANPANPCEACVTPVSPTFWTPSDGAACDDGQECTGEDQCQGGLCKGSKDPCDDDNPCTTNGCKEGEGCIHAAVTGACEDGDFCTIGDTCNNQVCVPGNKTLDCSDGDPCTDDTCKTGGGCGHTPHSGPCEDGDPCSVDDSCVLGECVGGAQKPSCNDSNPCTDDVCLPGKGCAHIPNLSPCEDDDVCTEGDTCSDGDCTAGFFIKECDDGDGCTKDVCEPFKGCNAFPKTGACDDGNPCTDNDFCQSGVCKGGAPTQCEDGNLCTDNVCNSKVPGGCVFPNNTTPCEDGDPCTEGDACKNGSCQAPYLNCDDLNPCTNDVCKGAAGCVHQLNASMDSCLLKITITSPARAITLSGNQTVTVKGKVVSPAAPLVSATLNGKPLQLDAQGKFTTTVKVTHGMNVLFGEAADEMGNTDKAMRSFYFSTKYQPMSTANPKGSSMPRGIYLFLGPQAIDDGNHKPPADDLATIFEIIIASFDIGALLPNPLLNNSNYKVTVSNVQFDPAQVQLVPINGGLSLYASISDFSANVYADGKCTFCPSASGTLSVTEIIIVTDLDIKTAGGSVQATMKNTDVILVNPDVDVNGILGSILDFLVDFIVDQFAPTIEGAFESELGKVLPDTLEDALNSLAFDTDFDVPPFFDGGKSVTISLNTGLETTFWTQDGGTFRMWAAATTAKKTSHTILGTLRRDGCLTGKTEALQLTQEDPLQIALSDDVLNQVLYSLWYGDGLEFPVPPSLLVGQDLSAFGVEDLELTLDFLLPPIVTSCNPYQDLLLQIGDIKVHATAKLFGQPVELNIYASAEAYVEMFANPAGIGLQITDIANVWTETVVLTAGLGTAEKIVDELVGEQLTPLLFDQLGSGALAGLPLPEIDLGGLAAGVPAGTSIAIAPKKVFRILGWTVVSGSIK